MNHPNKRLLFLTLRMFSATGGIERMCRILGKVFADLRVDQFSNVEILSMYDSSVVDFPNPYFDKSIFSSFSKNKLKFLFVSIWSAFKSDLIVLSHVHLAVVGWFVKLFFPQKKIILIAHGIEMWGKGSVLQNMFLQSIDKVVAVSQFTKEKIVAAKRMDANRIVVINNAIDPFLKNENAVLFIQDLRERYHLKNDAPVLLTLTRISSKDREKGYERVIHSLQNLKEVRSDFIYIIAGDIDDKEKNYLDQKLNDYNLKNNVVFTGFVEEKYIPSLYSLSDVFIMPSTKEGFGVAFLEAMYFGKPVIAGNLDGSCDALMNGKLGILIDPNDTENMAKVIAEVLINPVKYQPDDHLLMANFGYEAYQKKFVELFRSL